MVHHESECTRNATSIGGPYIVIVHELTPLTSYVHGACWRHGTTLYTGMGYVHVAHTPR